MIMNSVVNMSIIDHILSTGSTCCRLHATNQWQLVYNIWHEAQ